MRAVSAILIVTFYGLRCVIQAVACDISNAAWGLLGDRCASPPDGRSGRNGRYAMRDIGLEAFSVFPMRGPSFLSHRRLLSEGRGIPNARTPFGMDRIPCDNHIRWMPDGIPPEHFGGVFSVIVADLEGAGALSDIGCPDGRVPVALNGSEHFRSRKPHCGQCPTRRARGGTQYFHSFVCASMVAPGQSRTPPLAPEFVHPRDGTDKQDCGSRAAPAGAGRALRGRAAAGPFGRRPLCLPTALRSGPGRGRQFHRPVQAVAPQDVGRIPAGHGAAGDPPDRGPGLG